MPRGGRFGRIVRGAVAFRALARRGDGRGAPAAGRGTPSRLRPLAVAATLAATLVIGVAVANAAVAPTVTIEPPSPVNPSQGKYVLSGAVNPNGTEPEYETVWQFECSPSCGEPGGTIAPDEADHQVEAEVSGLEPNTKYTITLKATNAGGTTEASRSFKTTAIAPDVANAVVGDPSDTAARLNAYLNPHNSPVTECRFQYGATSAYGASVPCESTPSGNSVAAVSADLAGLAANTTYHFRFLASNGVAPTVKTDDQVFSTFPAPSTAACPNEAAREQEGATYLPECRGFELVSQAEKNNSAIDTVQVGPGGNHVLYQAKVADINFATADREALPGGLGVWHQASMLPPQEELAHNGSYAVLGVNADRTSLIIKAEEGLFWADTKTLLRLDDSGRQTTFASIWPDSIGVEVATVSADAEHVFFNLEHPFDPEQTAKTFDVYDVAAQPPLLVSRLPDGSVPTCGARYVEGFASSERQHWNSVDGSRVFFQSRGNSVNCEEAPLELYRRDTATETTTLISGPALANDSNATFLQASADGSSVVYATAAQLVNADANEQIDIYRWDEGSGNSCLTCVVADANVLPFGNNLSESIGVSEDLSHIYFVSESSLAPGAVAGEPSLYVLAHGELSYIAPASSIQGLNNLPAQGTTLNPEGDVLVFSSEAPRFNALTGADNGGGRQYYRYEAEERTLACISCAPNGPTARRVAGPMAGGEAGALGYVQVLSDNGARFFFRTDEALAAADENHATDLYEWHDGRNHLITNGLATSGSLFGAGGRPTMALRGISADGRDVFFTDLTHYTPSTADNSPNLYDARVGGGELLPPAPVPCAGEACQPGATPPPTEQGAATPSFSGPGNPAPQRKKAKRHHRRKHQKRANHNRRASR